LSGRPEFDTILPVESITIFLGAGSSKPFGYPLTAEIMPLIIERAIEGKLFERRSEGPASTNVLPDAAACGVLLRRLGMLFPGVSMQNATSAALPQVTDVLSLLDRLIADGLGLSAEFRRADVVETRMLVERAIAEVLDGPVSDPTLAMSLRERRRWADALVTRAERGDEITIVTTNYDLLFERSLYERLAQGAPVPRASQLAESVDYGFDWRLPGYGEHEPVITRPRRPKVRLFKLHGSLNWLRCEVCGYIYINPRGAVYRQAYREDASIHNSCTCGAWPLRTVLVTPSSVRDIRDFNLLSVWNSALEALRTADDWRFVGYSLPGEDVSIRSLLLRAYSGWHGAGERPTVHAYLHRTEPSGSTTAPPERARYEALFPGVTIHWGGVAEHIADLASELASTPVPNPEDT